MTHKKSYRINFSYDVAMLDENQSRAAMAEMILSNHDQIVKHLSNPQTNFDKIPPETLISMISTNLILNMFSNSVNTDCVETKLFMANEFIDGVKDLFLTCVMKEELIKTHEGNIN